MLEKFVKSAGNFWGPNLIYFLKLMILTSQRKYPLTHFYR